MIRSQFNLNLTFKTLNYFFLRSIQRFKFKNHILHQIMAEEKEKKQGRTLYLSIWCVHTEDQSNLASDSIIIMQYSNSKPPSAVNR